MPIIISEAGSPDAKLIERSPFRDEATLQDYIHRHPEAIPVYEIEEGKRLFVVAREFDTPSGQIDALAVDQDGDVYVIETKLYANSDKRRVVAQALDYGASLWKHFSDFGAFIQALDKHAQSHWNTPFRERVRSFFDLNTDDVEGMIVHMRDNLHRGKLKFVVLMDLMDDRLKDLISYVNENSKFAIYGVEIDFYKFNKYEIVIPRLYGAEIRNSDEDDEVITQEQLTERIAKRNTVDVAAAAEELRSRLNVLGFTTKPSRSSIAYGITVAGDFISMLGLDATNVWVNLPARVVACMSPEQLSECRDKKNYGEYYGKGPAYAKLTETVSGFVQAVSEVADIVRRAMSNGNVVESVSSPL